MYAAARHPDQQIHTHTTDEGGKDINHTIKNMQKQMSKTGISKKTQ